MAAEDFARLLVQFSERWHLNCVVREVEREGHTGAIVFLKQTGYIDLGVS